MENLNQDDMQNKKRSPLRVGLTSGVFIAAALLLVVVSTQIDIDRRFFVMALLLIAGLFVLARVVSLNPKNKHEAKDEAETCLPIIRAYDKSKSVDKLMADYSLWKAGEHTTYTRMHFAEQVINELFEAEEYVKALNVLYEVGELPFKAREHYDYDKYRSTCEAQLLNAIEAQTGGANR